MKNNSFKICVMASGGGGNFLYLINQQVDNDYEISCLVVNKECPAQQIARENSIPVYTVNDSVDEKNYCDLLSVPEIKESDIIILAGYMPIVPEIFIERYARPILNTHPSLLPKFGGRGMYGVNVHKAVLEANEQTTGCTCHIVDAGIDTGMIICQQQIAINESWDAWTLGGYVFLLEGPNLVKGINIVRKGVT